MDLLINGTPLASYGGSSLLDYTIGETEVTNETFQGMNRSIWTLLKSTYGMRTITITIVFKGPDLHAAKLQRSKLNSEVFGKTELYIPDDGFYYTVTCEKFGAEELVGIGEREAKIKSKYEFKGIRHGEKVTVTIPGNGKVYCDSTMPMTDCRLSATVGTSAATYQLGGAVFSTVTAGDVLVFDGVNKIITKNNISYASNVNWSHFPYLVPGENLIACPDDVTVIFWPAYI